MILRPYQSDAVGAVYQHLRDRDDNPCVVIPTAGGKSPCMAAVCRDAVNLWGGRVLILAHVRELLEQTAGKLRQMSPDLKIGIYSAGLGRRDTEQPVILAGIQSVYQRVAELGQFDLILIDEAHLIPDSGEGMYRTFLQEIRKIKPQTRVVGWTATPFRMSSGLICGPENILNHVCYEIGVRELIVQGHLCQLASKAGKTKPDLTQLHVRAGEFIADETEAAMDQADLVEAACDEIIELTANRKSVLIFASGIGHGAHVTEVLQDRGCAAQFLCGDTLPQERDDTIARFRGDSNQLFESPLKYLVNVNVLTTGFDAPNIDCVVLLRPTMSAGLYYQMVGRGFRLHPGKHNCLVLDYGDNVLRHGPVDQLRVQSRPDSNNDSDGPAKECPECQALIAAGYSRCPDCGFAFPPREIKHGRQASSAGVLSGQVTDVEYQVQEISYGVHYKKNGGPESLPTMRVSYQIGGFGTWQSEWICFEHAGYARRKAEDWWHDRTELPCPDTVEDAVEIANCENLLAPESITVRSIAGEKYDRIIAYKLPTRGDAYEGEEGGIFDEPVYNPQDMPF